ncbi:ATP-binding protein [uncultured Microscilla sp.]|uniref:sensor histidine kinase n=1 Tax=uncultured Microscilla sp. TaxID=432653 RepID=UPI002608EA46|nr:ATP-binding protein [uncultured Microscilla sp.]
MYKSSNPRLQLQQGVMLHPKQVRNPIKNNVIQPTHSFMMICLYFAWPFQEVDLIWLLSVGISSTFIVITIFLYQKKLCQLQLRLQELRGGQQQQILLAISQAQENERKRIAQNLHDELGVVLSTIKLYTNHLMDKSGLHSIAGKINCLIDVANQNLKVIAYNLTPQHLERFGLLSALNELFDNIRNTHQLKIQFHYDEFERLDIEKELGLYRIIHELINNTIKHSGANTVQVVLMYDSGHLDLNYQDDGVGVDLDTQKVAKQSGMGLQNILSRAQLMNVQVEFQSGAGLGFQASLQLEI